MAQITLKYNPAEIQRLFNEAQIRLQVIGQSKHVNVVNKQAIKDADTIRNLCAILLSAESGFRGVGGLSNILLLLEQGAHIVTKAAFDALLAQNEQANWEHQQMAKILTERFELDVAAELAAVRDAQEASNRRNGT